MKKILNAKTIICLILSTFAASGVILYGYHYPELFHLKNSYLLILLGVICSATATTANIMLGTYSLLTMKQKASDKIVLWILATSLIGSVPYGFLCYFSYEKNLPLLFDVILSIIVVIVNAGIGYTALKNVFSSLVKHFGKKQLIKKIPFAEIMIRCFGVLVGIVVSIIMYLATCHGLNDLFNKFDFKNAVDSHVSFYIAIISWIPVAALFANGNQTVANSIYQSVSDLKRALQKLTFATVLLLIYCLFSGSSIAMMMADTFDKTKQIPSFFKNENILFIVNHYLLYLALLSSAALNYFAITNLKQFFNKK